jgi:hypothetical protein
MSCDCKCREWRGIATAPPAGHTVLVYMKGTAGRGIYRAVCADWKDDGVNPRWRANSYGHVDDFPLGAEITHWQPLPAAPAAPPEPLMAQLLDAVRKGKP